MVPRDTRIFFFVDGLDEYSGEHNDICDLFSQTANSPRVKILVSSRPIPVYVEKFSGFPKLQLQDLTRDDIHQYTYDILGTNPILQGMETVETGVTARLVEAVTSKACGVFLWVVLVVRRLIVGLQNYESMVDLEREIGRLPSDLEKLYEHMLGSQSEQHRVLGSKYLQLVLRSLEIGIDLHLLQLSFAEADDYTVSLSSPIRELATEAESWICKATEGRLRSRCCGLIETRVVQPNEYSLGLPLTKSDKKVEFFHHTVVEFLQLGNIWGKLQSLTSKAHFSVPKALVSSSLAELKSVPLKECLPCGPDDSLVRRLFRMLQYEVCLGDSIRETFHHEYLPEFKRVIQFYWHDPSLFLSSDEEFNAVNTSIHRSSLQLRLAYPKNFAMSCLIRTPVEDLYEKFQGDFQISPAHMLMHFVDETDPRIRRSMAHTIMLGKHSWNAPEIDPNNDPDFLDTWSTRWAEISGEKDGLRSLSLCGYLLHYVFTVVDSPHNREAQLVMSSEDMMISLLDAINSILQGDGNFANLSHPDFFIKVRRLNNTTDRVEVISDVSLLAKLLWTFWTKAISSQAAHASGNLDKMADLACAIEDLISRQITHSGKFWSTLNTLARADRLQGMNACSKAKKEGPLRLMFLRLRKKKKVMRNSGIEVSPLSSDARDAPVISESPWRMHHSPS